MVDERGKRLVLIPTFLGFVCAVCYLIKIERQTALAEREFSDWIYDNNIGKYTDSFFAAEVTSLDELIYFDVFSSKKFAKLTFEEKHKVNHVIGKLRKRKALQLWLKSKGLSDLYLQSLKQRGVERLDQLREFPITSLETLTKKDTSLWDYHTFEQGIAQLEEYGKDVAELETELLQFYKAGVVPPNYYSWLTVLQMAVTILLITGVTAGMMFVSQTTNLLNSANSWLQQSGMLCQTSKKSFLNLLSGNYDIPQNTKVVWDWQEPQTVGKAMTFSVKFFHKNGKPYPISNADNITVDITHNGALVAKTMDLGSMNPEEANVAKVSFTVHKAGDYCISVMFSARHIKGSPFTRKFEAGPIDASKTGFMNYTSTVVCTPDTSYPLTIEARDAFGNLAVYKADQNNYFKIKVTESGSNVKYVPTTQIYYNAVQKQLTMHIKMEKEGCFQATVSYGDMHLKNGDFNILVLSSDDLACVEKNIKKSHNIWYEARLIECNHERLAKPKKVFIYITPKQLKLKEYFLKIIGKRLYTYRVCPSTKFTFNGFNNQYGCPIFTIDDGAQPPIVLAAKDRSIVAATFTKFLLRNIGGSETFQDKQSFFHHEIRTLHQKRHHSTMSVIKIDRSRLLHSSYKATRGFDITDWCKNFEISFQGEEGLDWGGVRREWFESLCTELFDPNASKLFQRLSDDSQGLVHPNNHRLPDVELKYYEFAGKIVGKCLYESALGGSYRQLVKAKFTRSFLAQLIGLRVHFKYFETDDPELYKTKIRYIEENDIEGMELTFSEEEYSPDGQTCKVIDLIPNGSRTPVTNENKLQYLDQLAQHRLANSVRDEIDSFLKGLNELIPDNLLSIFDENELELLMCGMRKYSVTDLKNNHVSTGSSATFRRVLDWFWTIIGSFTDEQMARLLQFTTGCSQLPPGGFSELVPKFQISPAYTYNTLPTAHTCFNNLCLPDYDSIEQFHRSLLIAINEGNQGFGLV